MAIINLQDARVAFSLNYTYTKEEVSRAYRKLALQTHPDKGGDEEAFNRITEMRDLLLDRLDRPNDSSFTFDPSDLEDVFSTIFRAGNPYSYSHRTQKDKSRRSHPPRIIEGELPLESVIIMAKTSRKIQLSESETCLGCNGRGSLNVRDRISCPECFGIGFSPRSDGIPRVCTKCDGSGYVYAKPCVNCNGAGRKIVHRNFTIDLNPLTIPDKTKEDSTDIWYRPLLSDKSKDGAWFRNGTELHHKLKINVFDVITQKDIEWVDLFNGNKYKISYGEGYREGTKMRLPRMGLKGRDGRGDLFLHIEAIFPRKEDLTKNLIWAINEYNTLTL